MMSLFSSPFCAAPAETSFTPLFRLLDDFESYQQQLQAAQQNNNNNTTTQRRRTSPRALPTFRPKFDVRETENTYELHGELAGLERENVEIEFTEPQTLVIRGRVERTYEDKPAEEKAADATPAEPTTTEADEKTKRRNSYQATVEDDPEEPSTPISTPPESPKPQPADKQAQKASAPQAPAAAPQPKYRAYERSVGHFSRAFSFPSRVDHEGVKATLDNGILTVSVPKAKKHEVRRIAIF